MPVHLTTARDLAAAPACDTWLAVTGTVANLDPAWRVPDLARRLERAFEQERETWWSLGHTLGQEPSAEIAHMPAAGAYGSDFGLMLAWSRIVAEAAAAPERCLVVCDDPWLFRHLAELDGVEAGRAPGLRPAEWRLALRGLLARTRVALRVARAAVRLRGQRKIGTPGAPVLLVYGHPESRADGSDAYFDDLMHHVPGLGRVLHTDAAAATAADLGTKGRAASLHAWGRPVFAVSLIAARWRPARCVLDGRHGWLVRRAAARENGGGGPAMNRWQLHCQRRWLDAIRPSCIAWPWENHAWERALCREARTRGIGTVGYQHTVIGPHQINYAVHSNPDGLASIPDTVAANGPAYRDEMAAWGVPENRLTIGGALRFRALLASAGIRPVYDPDAPLFVALSAVPAISRDLVALATRIAAAGHPVLVKNHPMYPVALTASDTLSITEIPLRDQPRLSGVLFSTGTTGLESLLAGLPTFRLVLDDRLAIDVLPTFLSVPAVSLDDGAETIAAALAAREAPQAIDPASVLCPPDLDLWRRLLGGAAHAADTEHTPAAARLAS